MRLEIWHSKQSNSILERASSVWPTCYLQYFYMKKQHNYILTFLLQLTTDVIHNMRTIKQLSVEKEVLQRYSQFIHQEFMLVTRIS
jgi:F420-0:gamma-glutamyl ligase-like protein